MGLTVSEVRTGRAYLIDGDVRRAELEQIASRVLANGVIESVHFDRLRPREVRSAATSTSSSSRHVRCAT